MFDLKVNVDNEDEFNILKAVNRLYIFVSKK